MIYFMDIHDIKYEITFETMQCYKNNFKILDLS